ncbi:hypothetical protein NX862_06730 [Rhodobacter sp. KR11]|uniref:hypothetical protein n=1 Tax=Rhodobacter sp. KR11 TaxID=2974588 RepID=UPI002223AD93|nr:hypothetical protein [Rhodobacter sp. KR11]MCW1918440.1 hypothetical protein [Rhodobacter sp. KR11]
MWTAFGVLCVVAQINMGPSPALWEGPARDALFPVAAPICQLLMIVSVIPIVFRLQRNPVLLRISAGGLEVWLLGLIPWEDVGRAQVIQVRQGRFNRDCLRIELHNLTRYKTRMDFWSQLLGDQNLNRGGLLYRSRVLDAPLAEVMAALEAHRPQETP